MINDEMLCLEPSNADCPPDPYRYHCPPECQILSDDRGCSLCVCTRQFFITLLVKIHSFYKLSRSKSHEFDINDSK